VRNPAGGLLTFKLRGEQTVGALTVLESRAAPGEGPPLHLHADANVLYVLEGSLRLKLEDEVRQAPAGAVAYIPRGLPHTWQNVGGAAARFLAIFTPAAFGMETFLNRFAELPPEAPVFEAFATLGREAGLQVVGPPLSESNPL
jgi:quercetin dioxygenase-like cupin family protein